MDLCENLGNPDLEISLVIIYKHQAHVHMIFIVCIFNID